MWYSSWYEFTFPGVPADVLGTLPCCDSTKCSKNPMRKFPAYRSEKRASERVGDVPKTEKGEQGLETRPWPQHLSWSF